MDALWSKLSLYKLSKELQTGIKILVGQAVLSYGSELSK